MARSSNFLLKALGLVPKALVKIANFTRHLLFLLLFFALLWLAFGNKKLVLKPDTALVLAPKGNLVEEYSGTPAQRFFEQLQGAENPQTRLRDVLKAIDEAAFDDKISVLVLDADYLWSAGLANLREIERAILKFRNAGKPVIGIGSSFSQAQYYFASLGDEVLLDPQGLVFLQGFGNYRNYFKDTLDKLGVDVHLFRVGEYKSAAEPFVRNNMSPEAREAALHYLGDLWDIYLTGVAARRNLSVQELKGIVDLQAKLLKDNNGNGARMALDSGLVDMLMTQHQMEEYLATKSAKEDDGYRRIDFEDYLTLVKARKILPKPHKVAVVVAEGAITAGKQPPGTVGGESTAALLREAKNDPRVKAVVLRVNSPGGEVFPSEQIRREVEAVRNSGKPVVVSMGNVAASGGYWISMSADRILADEATITGSIGIFGLLIRYPKTLNKIGVHTDGVATTKWVGAFRPDLPLDKEVAELIQSSIEHGYQMFITLVAKYRKLDVDMVDKIARGRVWTGRQAKELGLVDKIGSLDDAIDSAAKLASIPHNYSVIYLEPQLSGWEKFLFGASAKILSWAPSAGQFSNPELAMLRRLRESNDKAWQLIENASEGDATEYSFCFCEPRL